MVVAVAVENSFRVEAEAIGPCSRWEGKGCRLACAEAVHRVDRRTVGVGDRLGQVAWVAIADLAAVCLVVW